MQSKGDAKQLTNGDDWNDTDPQWSPDSRRIAFVSDRTGKEFDAGHNKDIWVIPAAGGGLQQISNHLFDDTQPRWSPDGQQIAFTGETRRRELPKIYVAPATGGKRETGGRWTGSDSHLARLGSGAGGTSFRHRREGPGSRFPCRSGRAARIARDLRRTRRAGL